MELPPNLPERYIHKVAKRHREDAIQEAWVAYLQGQDPINAIWRYAKQEYRHERRQIDISQVNDEATLDELRDRHLGDDMEFFQDK